MGVVHGASIVLLTVSLADCSANRDTMVTANEGHETTFPDAAPSITTALTPPPLSLDTPSYEPDPPGIPAANTIGYAGLGRDACEAELRRRSILFEHAMQISGVVTPVWLRGPLHGVSIHSALSPKQRQYSSAEIFDCRLLLAMDDFASLVAEHDVVEIVHMSAFRPRSSFGCTRKHDGKQHCAALAVDIGSFRKRDGSVLVVERDFHGKIGRSTCGAGISPKPPSLAADELWSFVCEAARLGIFQVILTPNYNRQHKNHFHLEITPDADETFTR